MKHHTDSVREDQLLMMAVLKVQRTAQVQNVKYKLLKVKMFLIFMFSKPSGNLSHPHSINTVLFSL